MHYASQKHEKLYRNVIRGRDHPSGTLAALYLLTAKRKLWLRWCRALNAQGIDWLAGREIDPGWDGHYLEKAAKSIAGKDSQQVTLHDLLDYKDYPHELFRLVVTALLIARCEPKATREILIRKGLVTSC
jgi:hypothetical protein